MNPSERASIRSHDGGGRYRTVGETAKRAPCGEATAAERLAPKERFGGPRNFIRGVEIEGRAADFVGREGMLPSVERGDAFEIEEQKEKEERKKTDAWKTWAVRKGLFKGETTRGEQQKKEVGHREKEGILKPREKSPPLY